MKPPLVHTLKSDISSLDELLKRPEQAKTLIKIIDYAVTQAMVKCNKVKPLMTKKEAYEVFNQPAVDRALKQIPCPFRTVKKGGKTSNVYIVREDFEKWIAHG